MESDKRELPPPRLRRPIVVSVAVAVAATAAAALVPLVQKASDSPPSVDPQPSLELVAAETGDADLREVPLTAPRNARAAPGSLKARERTDPVTGSGTVVSLAQPVNGYGVVGVTWDPLFQRVEGEITVEARSRDASGWSAWERVEFDEEHSPEPESSEGRGERPGTAAVVVGVVDEVQVRVSDSEQVPADLKLAIIETSTQPELELAAPEIDTAELEGSSEADATLSAATGAPGDKPQIFSRKQWGANEAWRDKGSLRYGTIQGAFVHHTVTANDYTKAQVPGLLRSIYAYHTRSRGWSDIGYNFLVDRFGRIWEGRAGGVDKAVVGAHTLGYNEYSFAMSAIGNFETARPTVAMIEAYGELFAWKLGKAGVDPTDKNVQIGGKTFQAINGHRDADATACPGRYLYERLGTIRELAGEGGPVTPPTPPTPPKPTAKAFNGRTTASNLTGSRFPDLLLRRASDGKGVIVPTGGLTRFSGALNVPTGWKNAAQVFGSPDLTGDRRADVLVVRSNGKAMVRPGNAQGRFTKARKTIGVFVGHSLITAVGDLNRDGRGDFVARTATGALRAFLGGGNGGFQRRLVKTAEENWNTYTLLAATGDVTSDGIADVLARDRRGRLWVHPGKGGAKLAPRRLVGGGYNSYSAITGFGDFTRDGKADLFVQRADNRYGYVLAGRGNGTFAPPAGPMQQFAGMRGITGGGSFTGNGLPDVIGRTGSQLKLFSTAKTYNLGGPVQTNLNLKNADAIVNAGDFDGDGLGDVMTRNASNGRLFLRKGNGRGTFSKVFPLGSGFERYRQLFVVGDVTGDGKPDLVGSLPTGRALVYPGNGTGKLGDRIKARSKGTIAQAWDRGVDLRPFDWVVEVSDADGDNRPDLIVRAKANGVVYVLRRSGSGFFAASFLGESLRGYDLAG